MGQYRKKPNLEKTEPNFSNSNMGNHGNHGLWKVKLSLQCLWL